MFRNLVGDCHSDAELGEAEESRSGKKGNARFLVGRRSDLLGMTREMNFSLNP